MNDYVVKATGELLGRVVTDTKTYEMRMPIMCDVVAAKIEIQNLTNSEQIYKLLALMCGISVEEMMTLRLCDITKMLSVCADSLTKL